MIRPTWMTCRSKTPLTALALGAVLCVVGRNASAQPAQAELVVLRGERGAGQQQLSGRIIDYTGEKIVIETQPGGRELSFPAERVVRVQTPQTEGHVEGLRMFGLGRFEEAQTALERALTVEDRIWVRREILAVLLRCSLRRGEYEPASARFVALVRSDPKTRHFPLVPLAWSSAAVPAGALHPARQWLSDAQPVVRLLGASYLLDDSPETAQRELNRLSTDPDIRVQTLAQAQLWRLALAGELPSEWELDRWQLQIDSMPAELRGGPYYLLGRARFARREFGPAAAALLWVPLVYPEDAFLAAHSALQAGAALEQLGQPNEAANLYHEVVRQYGGTWFAETAAAALKSLEAAPTSADQRQAAPPSPQ